MNENIEIREIIKSDNIAISLIIKSVLTELNANIKGTAFYDKETNAMFEAYQTENSIYFTALLNNEVIGGCGINKLQGSKNNICELQKMYISPKARGLKIGKQLLEKCLIFASKHYDECYLETFPQMKSAIHLYQKNGFIKLNYPLGNTSHTACNVWMSKKINELTSIKELRNIFDSKLISIYPKTEIESFFYLLTEAYFDLKRIDIALDPNLKIEFSVKLKKALEQLIKQEPIQYIIGQTEFYSLPFKVNKNVLIPRPETEELVDWIINDCNSKENNNVNILDIGTGSGCIAISIAKNLPNAKVYALDISKDALQITKENAATNQVKIEFITQDILNTKNYLSQTKFDIIVSNPPYVRELEKKEINANVLENEPHLALFVADNNPLLFYDKIADFAKENLSESGILYFEINQYLGKETVALLTKKGFKNSVLKKDIFENDRMVSCKLN